MARFQAESDGIITAITATAKDSELAGQGLARHANISTTRDRYKQTVPAETLAAMSKLEREFAECGAKVEQAAHENAVN